jgi:hypothetical protein
MVLLTKLYFSVYLLLLFRSPHLRVGSISTSGSSELKTFLSQFSIWNLTSVMLKKRKSHITFRSWPKMGDIVLQNFGIQKGCLQRATFAGTWSCPDERKRVVCDRIQVQPVSGLQPGGTRRRLRGYAKTSSINQNETQGPLEPWTSSDPRT